MQRIGDLHNFGRSVEQDGRFLLKPRNVLWERLVLGDGALRSTVENIFRSNHLTSPYSSIPTVVFENFNSREGRVQILDVSPVSRPFSPQTSYGAGSVIALCTVLGIGDLHRENVLFGECDGKIVFVPIDIEGVCDNYILPSQTLLTPSGKFGDADCGARGWMDHLRTENPAGHIAALCNGYAETVRLLLNSIEEIARTLEHNPETLKSPIRCYLRPTSHYYAVMRDPEKELKLQVPLLNSERAQLARGDIPFYWRILGDEYLYFTEQPDQPGKLPLNQIAGPFKLLFHADLHAWTHHLKLNADTIFQAGVLHLARHLLKTFSLTDDKFLKTRIRYRKGVLEYSDKHFHFYTDIPDGL